MKSNLTVKIAEELIRKGYQVSEIFDEHSDVLLVKVHTAKYNMELSINLYIPVADNPVLGFACINGLSAVKPENRIRALECINNINNKSQLKFIITEDNVVSVKQPFYSTKGNLFEQYISFFELFSFFFESDSIMQELRNLVSL